MHFYCWEVTIKNSERVLLVRHNAAKKSHCVDSLHVTFCSIWLWIGLQWSYLRAWCVSLHLYGTADLDGKLIMTILMNLTKLDTKENDKTLVFENLGVINVGIICGNILNSKSLKLKLRNHPLFAQSVYLRYMVFHDCS